jgi:hypothetical protein
VVRHIFQAFPVWIYTQSNITSIIINVPWANEKKHAGSNGYNMTYTCKWCNLWDKYERKQIWINVNLHFIGYMVEWVTV